MCPAEDETCRADAIQVYGAAPYARYVQEAAEADGREPIRKGREAPVRGCEFTPHGPGTFFLLLRILYLFQIKMVR